MRIPLSKLATSLSAFTSSTVLALLSVSPIHEYVDGTKTDNVVGTRYSVADPETFEKFDVKIMKATPIITQKQLDAKDERVWVEFSGALVKPFKVEFGSALCSVTADDVKLIKDWLCGGVPPLTSVLERNVIC